MSEYIQLLGSADAIVNIRIKTWPGSSYKERGDYSDKWALRLQHKNSKGNRRLLRPVSATITMYKLRGKPVITPTSERYDYNVQTVRETSDYSDQQALRLQRKNSEGNQWLLRQVTATITTYERCNSLWNWQGSSMH